MREYGGECGGAQLLDWVKLPQPVTTRVGDTNKGRTKGLLCAFLRFDELFYRWG